MKLQSKYFDSIRVAGKRGRGASKAKAGAEPAGETLSCQWKGCEKAGNHRAPKGRGRDGEYYWFCVDHVRQYNNNYNYFDGMSDAQVEKFLKESITGHRPTWKMGDGNAAEQEADPLASEDEAVRKARDPHGFFAWRAKQAREDARTKKRTLKPLERKALKTLHLGADAGKDDIKTRYKALVKEHHPDANGGDRRSEEKLREILQAYNYLKQAGLV